MLRKFSIVAFIISLILSCSTFISVLARPDLESFSFPTTKVIIEVTKTKQLSIVTQPKNAVINNSKLNWVSEDPSIVTVNNKGEIKGVAIGKTKINVTYKEKKQTCEVEVLPLHNVAFGLEYEYSTIRPGDTMQVELSINPNNDFLKNVTYTSSNQSVATISETGLITAISEGETLISAENSNKNTYSFMLKVSQIIPIEKIEAKSGAYKNDKITYGTSSTAEIVVYPKNATTDAVTWESSNPGVISINSEGKWVACGAGSAILTATTQSGKTSSVNLYVPTVTPSFININTKNLVHILHNPLAYRVKVGDTFKLTVEIQGFYEGELVEATTRDVEWSSDRPDFISVDENGVVTVLKETILEVGGSVPHKLPFSVNITVKVKGMDKVKDSIFLQTQ